MSIGHLHFTGNSLAQADTLFINILQTDLVARVGNTAHFTRKTITIITLRQISGKEQA